MSTGTAVTSIIQKPFSILLKPGMIRAIINFSLLLKEHVIEVALSTGELAKTSPNKAAYQAKTLPRLSVSGLSLAPITHRHLFSMMSDPF